MNIFLVGGAVRDKRLGRPVTERDWVVVGSSPQEMIDAGFTPVGQDFPVFLHPTTKEEYALARTERKTGVGYAGFSFYCGTDVTLEDDLIRRDLTINAMAEDEQGNVIDPYGGLRDLEQRLLRHASPAFSEDPVRILRIARFAARYHHLGFTVADETRNLMQLMVANGEANHLVAERVWKETERALGEPRPDVFIQVLRDCHALSVLMPEVNALFGVPQTAIHHPEIDTGIHTLMSLQQAVRLKANTRVRFAVLTHDLGKGITPENEWPRHIAHEHRGIRLVDALCDRLCAPKEYRELAKLVCEFHTHCHRALELKPATVLSLFKHLDAFRRPERIEDFLVACESDSRGRTGFEDRDYPQTAYLRAAYEDCRHVDTTPFLAQGFKGKAIGEAVDNERITRITQRKKAHGAEHHD